MLVLMSRRKKRDVWPAEFLALAGAWRGDIPRPGETQKIRTVSIKEASRSLGEYASELKGAILVVTKGQGAVAALLPLKNIDRESLILSGHPEFLELIERAREEIESGRTISLAEMKSRILRRPASAPRGRGRRAGRRRA
jgi:hypothetical protein